MQTWTPPSVPEAAPSGDRLRIALVSPPMLPVPPPTYAGTERVVAALGEELVARGHEVTLFAPGDSQFSGTLVASPEQSLWSQEYRDDVSSHINVTLARVWAATRSSTSSTLMSRPSAFCSPATARRRS